MEKGVFYAKKYLSGASTWLLCAILLLPCYLKTHILAMGILMPILLLLAVGFFVAGKKVKVEVSNGKVTFWTARFLSVTPTEIPLKNIKRIKVHIGGEEEDIFHIQLETSKGVFSLPDIDEKDKFVEYLKKVHSSVKVVEVTDYTEEEMKKVRGVYTISIILGILGGGLGILFLPYTNSYELFINVVKGSFTGVVTGSFLWFFVHNIKLIKQKA